MVKLRIEIDTDLTGKREIVVRDKDGQGKKRNPPVEVEPEGSIRWRAKAATDEFHVVFFEDETRTKVIWPFQLTGPNATPPDGHDGLGRPYLKVVQKPAKVCWLSDSLATSKIKYDVVKEPEDGVPALDPVIIIKPPDRNLRFALLCALAGAVVGAFVGALLASRPW